jgi:atypical dual specificity phosphatase
MSFLSDLQAYSQSKLQRTTTRVTNGLGQTHHESKSQDGAFEICDKSTDSNGPFMIIDSSPDEKLHHVIDGVYIGSQDAAFNLPALNEFKITHILNVATGIKNAFPEQYKYLNIELLDVPETNIRKEFTRTNEFIQQALADNGRVLIHCNAGISRSSTIVLAYLLGIHRMKYEDAYTLLKTARSNIRPNDGFVQQLKEYAAEITRTTDSRY